MQTKKYLKKKTTTQDKANNCKLNMIDDKMFSDDKRKREKKQILT